MPLNLYLGTRKAMPHLNNVRH